MNIVYIISIIILMIILFIIYKYTEFILKNWDEATSSSSKILFMIGIITFACVVVCWVFLIYWTIDCWYISNYTSRPKPHFLVMYILGLFVLGITMALSQLFLGLSQFKKDNTVDTK